jgi:hypothetical protein
MVSPLASTPDGLTNKTRWLAAVLIFFVDNVSENPLTEAAWLAGVSHKTAQSVSRAMAFLVVYLSLSSIFFEDDVGARAADANIKTQPAIQWLALSKDELHEYVGMRYPLNAAVATQ